MMGSRAASRYARALFNLALERQQRDAVDQGLSVVLDMVARHAEITHLVQNSTISQAEKEDFIEKVLPKDVPALIPLFLKLLVRKRRFLELGAIQAEFHALVEKQAGIEEVTAVTAVPLHPQAESKLKELLARKLKMQIRLLTETDPSMIGGLILRFGGREIDASFKNRLWEIKQKLMAL